MQKKIRIITLMVVFVLTALTSFGASKNYLQVSDIEPKLSNIQIDNKPILAYGEDSNGFISYTVVDESSFDDFFKETASLDAITNISNLLVTDFNKKLNTLSDKSTAKVVYADLLESIKYSYNALDKEVKNLNNLKDTGKNLSVEKRFDLLKQNKDNLIDIYLILKSIFEDDIDIVKQRCKILNGMK